MACTRRPTKHLLRARGVDDDPWRRVRRRSGRARADRSTRAPDPVDSPARTPSPRRGDSAEAAVPRAGSVAGCRPLDRYATLSWPDGRAPASRATRRPAAAASTGAVTARSCRSTTAASASSTRDVVLADIRAQVAAGAQHITFGDPDFFNGIGHARRVVDALRAEFPGVTYDVTIKVEHLLKHRATAAAAARHRLRVRDAAVESVDDDVLGAAREGAHARRFRARGRR